MPPGKRPTVPVEKEAGWAPDLVWMTWRGEKYCLYWCSNSDPSAVQHVASHYADCAIPTPCITSWDINVSLKGYQVISIVLANVSFDTVIK
jgi:hypothetical protein